MKTIRCVTLLPCAGLWACSEDEKASTDAMPDATSSMSDARTNKICEYDAVTKTYSLNCQFVVCPKGVDALDLSACTPIDGGAN